MNPKWKQLIESISGPLLAAIKTLKETLEKRLSTAEGSLSEIKQENVELRALIGDYAAKQLSIEKLTESVTAAFRERDGVTLKACSDLITALTATVQDQFRSFDQKLVEKVAAVQALIKEPPPPLDMEAVALAAAELVPVPKDGKDGVDGKDGQSVTLEQVEQLVVKAVSEVRVPTLADVLQNAMPPLVEKVEALSSTWALSFERLAQERFLKIVDQMPKPKDGVNGKDGTNGRDAFDLESLMLEAVDGGRVIKVLAYSNGKKHEYEVKTNFTVYRGFYKPSQEYEAGDAVTFGGSLFIANVSTKSKPETDDTWRLAVKRGRDGKDGKQGEKGEKGKDGKDGVTPVKLG